MSRFISEAIVSICPDAQFSISNGDYSQITWISFPEGQEKPTKEEVEAEIQRLQELYEKTEYQRLRAPEYPDFKDYLDGIVKEDQEQVQDYINKCLAVKAKYPKPEDL